MRRNAVYTVNALRAHAEQAHYALGRGDYATAHLVLGQILDKDLFSDKQESDLIRRIGYIHFANSGNRSGMPYQHQFAMEVLHGLGARKKLISAKQRKQIDGSASACKSPPSSRPVQPFPTFLECLRGSSAQRPYLSSCARVRPCDGKKCAIFDVSCRCLFPSSRASIARCVSCLGKRGDRTAPYVDRLMAP